MTFKYLKPKAAHPATPPQNNIDGVLQYDIAIFRNQVVHNVNFSSQVTADLEIQINRRSKFALTSSSLVKPEYNETQGTHLLYPFLVIKF